jgi:hypothetical protein
MYLAVWGLSFYAPAALASDKETPLLVDYEAWYTSDSLSVVAKGETFAPTWKRIPVFNL